MTPALAEDGMVEAALHPYRGRLGEDAADFTRALLGLAKANAKGTAGFNTPSPQDAVALHALAHWRRDAQHALKAIKALNHAATGRGVAERWLKTLIGALDFQRQGLSLVDPAAAAEASRRARKAIASAQRLEAQLDRVLL
jgi:hypothetical protein